MKERKKWKKERKKKKQTAGRGPKTIFVFPVNVKFHSCTPPPSFFKIRMRKEKEGKRERKGTWERSSKGCKTRLFEEDGYRNTIFCFSSSFIRSTL